MKIKEINELDAKALAEKLEAEVAKLDQLKLTHTILVPIVIASTWS